jgi:hypothetical protein
MILLPPPCEHCGEMATPEEVACDKCQRTQKIEDFSGLILHFSAIDGTDCDNDCEHCEEEQKQDAASEFHFCDIKCLSEYIADPNDGCFPGFEEKGLALYCDSKNASLLFFALGRCDFSE